MKGLLHKENKELNGSFSGHDCGKRIHFAARWENTRGVKGHWCEIESAIIP
ncbi:MAG: hypothetical protein LBR08_08985 [Bacteroidales bacterium]|jgi:hypothetical protein|nr:hypothetical protein [Bacteroidales bacterium]